MFSDELKHEFGAQHFTSLVIRNNVGYNRILSGRIENNQCVLRCTDKYICPRQYYADGQNYPEHEEIVRIDDVVDEIVFPFHSNINLNTPGYVIYDLSFNTLDPDYPMTIASIYVQV